MNQRMNLTLRCVVSFAALVSLFALRWRPQLQHFDFQVWEAAVEMIGDGRNPYEPRALNNELQANPDLYGSDYDDDNFYMYLSHPPTWLATIRALGTSALSVAFLGAALLYGSIVMLMRDRSFSDTVVAILCTTAFMIQNPSSSSFLLGQWGFFVAGMVGLHLVARSTFASEVPTAFLAAKPHIAFAAGIVGLVRNRSRDAVLRLFAPYALLITATMLLFGPHVWPWFVEAMLAGSAHPVSTLPDMSFGTLTPLLPWRSLGLAGVVVGLGLSTAISWKLRDRDPSAVLFASLAIAIYLSGHAFVHDWLWLPLVPVALRWRPPMIALGTLGLAQAIVLAYHYEQSYPQIQPAVGLIVTVGLVWIAARSTQPVAPHEDRALVSDEPVGQTQPASV